MRLEVLGYRILIIPEEIKEKTKGGIIIPDESKERLELGVTKGKVIGKGEKSFLDEDGKPLKRQPKIGDIVVFAKYSGLPVECDDVMYRIMNDADVLAIEEKKE